MEQYLIDKELFTDILWLMVKCQDALEEREPEMTHSVYKRLESKFNRVLARNEYGLACDRGLPREERNRHMDKYVRLVGLRDEDPP